LPLRDTKRHQSRRWKKPTSLDKHPDTGQAPGHARGGEPDSTGTTHGSKIIFRRKHHITNWLRQQRFTGERFLKESASSIRIYVCEDMRWMSAEKPSPDEAPDRRSRLPPVGEPVWVKCDGYRTMAVLGADGKWRKLVDGGELTGTVEVMEPS